MNCIKTIRNGTLQRYTTRTCSACNQNYEVAKILLDAVLDLLLATNSGKTPLHLVGRRCEGGGESLKIQKTSERTVNVLMNLCLGISDFGLGFTKSWPTYVCTLRYQLSLCNRGVHIGASIFFITINN
jgi:hypothetical protein